MKHTYPNVIKYVDGYESATYPYSGEKFTKAQLEEISKELIRLLLSDEKICEKFLIEEVDGIRLAQATKIGLKIAGRKG